MSKSLHVLVIGAGIGGLCLAQGLRRAGVSVAVYERDRAATDRVTGYRIHLNPAGARALHACLPPALWERFVATAGDPGGLGFFTENLKQLLVINDHDVHGATTDAVERSHAVDRITLRHLLLDGLHDVVTFNKTFTRYQPHEDTITAFFDDGSSATGDLLVGADGVNSRVGDHFLPQSGPVDTEALSVASKLALTPATRAWLSPRLATSMNMIIAQAPYFLFTSPFDRREQPAEHRPRRDNDSYILCALIAHRSAYPPEVRDLDAPALQQVVADLTARWHPDLRRLLADAEPDSVSLQPHRASVPVPAWKTTTVTLIGDAIHAMPPVGGLGGNAALRDAHLLCRALAHVNTGAVPLLEAVQHSETEIRAQGYAARRQALATQHQGLRSNPLAVTATRAWFRCAHTIPTLRRVTVPYRRQARKRPWEEDVRPGDAEHRSQW
ncbi:MAG: FAD-dependent oxidoreductase [Sciscionella sp.]